MEIAEALFVANIGGGAFFLASGGEFFCASFFNVAAAAGAATKEAKQRQCVVAGLGGVVSSFLAILLVWFLFQILFEPVQN